MTTQAATHAASAKRHAEQQERRMAIRNEGLRYSSDVARRFGISNPTAVADLRAVYGELPCKPATPKPARNRREPKGVHVNFRMSIKTFEVLQLGAVALGLTESEAVRYAIIKTFASNGATHDLE